MKQTFTAGQKVMISSPMDPPTWCVFDDDRGRVSKHIKKAIMERFFKGDPKLTCEILHAAKDAEELRKLGRTKVRIRTPAGETIVIPVDVDKLKKTT